MVALRASQMRYASMMKDSSIPSVRVEAAFRAEIEAALEDGESLSEFVESAVRTGVERRRLQAEFIARGLAAREEARRTGVYVDADAALARLSARLDAARAKHHASR